MSLRLHALGLASAAGTLGGRWTLVLASVTPVVPASSPLRADPASELGGHPPDRASADARAIRCDAQQLKDWTCPHCVDDARVLATGGNDGSTPLWYAADNGTHVIVSLAGTNTQRFESINTNLQILALPPAPAHFPDAAGVRLHSGYYNAFTQIHGPIDDAIRAASGGAAEREVVVTGHSLGGAIGSILATWLLRKYPGKVTGLFFAPPRQGNAAWADYVDKLSGGRIQHMNNFNDIVPHLPPRALDYRHYGHEVYITSWGGQEYISCEGQEDKKCAGRFLEPGQLFASLIPNMDAIVHSGPYAGVMMGCVGGPKRVGDAGIDRDDDGRPIDTPETIESHQVQ